MWNKFWSIRTQPKIQDLGWRILNKVIPTRSDLSKRGDSFLLYCPNCLTQEETLEHPFLKCDKDMRIWFGSILNINFNQNHNIKFIEWLWQIIEMKDKDIIEKC